MSRAMTDDDLIAIERLLSAERLSRLTELTGATSHAIDFHQETLRVSAGLLNVIACMEIALRNAVDENLTVHFGTKAWLTHPPAPFQWKKIENEIAKKALGSAQRAEYSKLSQAGKAELEKLAFPSGRPVNTSHLKRALERRKQIDVSSGKVIAETTFYLWKRLYSPEYEQSLWRPTLKRTFPNKAMKRAIVASRLEQIYQARNRLAHHEPVLHRRFQEAVTGIKFISENLGMPQPDPMAPLAKLIASDLADVELRAKALHARLDAYRPAASS